MLGAGSWLVKVAQTQSGCWAQMSYTYYQIELQPPEFNIQCSTFETGGM
jgi:hypothetical protein